MKQVYKDLMVQYGGSIPFHILGAHSTKRKPSKRTKPKRGKKSTRRNKKRKV